MSLTRRSLVKTVAAGLPVSVAGCLGLGESNNGIATAGNDDEPLEATADSLLLDAATLSDQVGEAWTAGENRFLGPELLDNTNVLRNVDAAVVYGLDASEVENLDNVDPAAYASTVRVYESVDSASQAFEESAFQSGFGYESRPIAVESIGGTANDRTDSRVVFRDANAIGLVAHRKSADTVAKQEQRTLEVAAAMHRSWR